MSEIVIRDVASEDVSAIRGVVRDVWDWDSFLKDDGTIDACVAVYFAPVLHKATFGRVALLDGKVVGVAFGSAKGESPCCKDILEDLTPHIVTMLQAGESDRRILSEYFHKTHGAYAELISGIEDEYNGALDFLAVSDSAQGMGIGKQLWHAVKAYLERRNVSKLYLFSDAESNFGFYESQGFRKRREKEIRFISYDEKEVVSQYLYEYCLK